MRGVAGASAEGSDTQTAPTGAAQGTKGDEAVAAPSDTVSAPHRGGCTAHVTEANSPREGKTGSVSAAAAERKGHDAVKKAGAGSEARGESGASTGVAQPSARERQEKGGGVGVGVCEGVRELLLEAEGLPVLDEIEDAVLEGGALALAAELVGCKLALAELVGCKLALTDALQVGNVAAPGREQQGQGRHAVAPGVGLNVSAGQGVHVKGEEAPLAADQVPAGHAFCMAETEPAGQ